MVWFGSIFILYNSLDIFAQFEPSKNLIDWVVFESRVVFSLPHFWGTESIREGNRGISYVRIFKGYFCVNYFVMWHNLCFRINCRIILEHWNRYEPICTFSAHFNFLKFWDIRKNDELFLLNRLKLRLTFWQNLIVN